MEGLWVILAISAVLFFPVGSIFGFLAYKNLNKQAARLHSLSLEVQALRGQVKRNEALALAAAEQSTALPDSLANPIEQSSAMSSVISSAMSSPLSEPADLQPDRPDLSRAAATPPPASAAPVAEASVSRPARPKAQYQESAYPYAALSAAPSRVMQSLKQNWMVWLGGLSVALAGIFMVHYSVSEGLMGPVLQLLLALSVGGVLHGAAEYLRRRYGYRDQIFAALAGGGSVTLYAALLAGIHHYQLIGPWLGLALLAAVSLGTMGLARLHGPLLALMGLSSAYIVPLLIDSDAGSVAFVLSYSLLITVSSLLLMRYVFRDWLWYTTLAGALLWWLAALLVGGPFSGAELGGGIMPTLPLYLTALWLSFALLPNGSQIARARLRDAFIALLIAWALSIAGQPVSESLSESPLFLSWLLLLPVALLMPQSRQALWYLPWGAVFASAAGWLLYLIGMDLDTVYLRQFPLEQQAGFSRYLILAAAICAGLGFWQWRLDDKRRWASLSLVAPLVWLTLGWLLIQGFEPSMAWALGALLAGTLYGALAGLLRRYAHYQSGQVWAILAAHLSYSLAVTMALREASLTQALSVQFVSLVCLARRYRMPQLYLLLKVVLAIVVARLTFNPWLNEYQAYTHWSLWTYGGTAALAGIATYLSERTHAIRPWLEAASLHLLVLFLGAELRYWLYDGDIFSQQYSFTEATVNTLLWGGLSITYLLRAKTAQQLAWLYRSCALALLGLASLSYLLLISWYNPWWGETEISARPLFNILLPAYGGPVLLAFALSRFPQWVPRMWALAVAGGGFMLFSALEIRQLWRGSDMAFWSGMNSGELYTYSVVGMLYAIIAIIYATQKGHAQFYKIGMTLLGLVIAKIFLIDMDGLQGLWRVAAFMGLGLALLGLAWMHQKVQRAVGLVKGAR
ncbi:DUF2339 domain-containing protein [Oceanisphaera sp. W20_SRM_FM3]|uniref:DUF2339 domain-containing protein n=1 Tax=Oceanisphaera sp. W20_SRM_FM3 TaxID=3240267 RepID=UPI003F950D98